MPTTLDEIFVIGRPDRPYAAAERAVSHRAYQITQKECSQVAPPQGEEREDRIQKAMLKATTSDNPEELPLLKSLYQEAQAFGPRSEERRSYEEEFRRAVRGWCRSKKSQASWLDQLIKCARPNKQGEQPHVKKIEYLPKPGESDPSRRIRRRGSQSEEFKHTEPIRHALSLCIDELKLKDGKLYIKDAGPWLDDHFIQQDPVKEGWVCLNTLADQLQEWKGAQRPVVVAKAPDELGATSLSTLIVPLYASCPHENQKIILGLIIELGGRLPTITEIMGVHKYSRYKAKNDLDAVTRSLHGALEGRE
ncbi:hypothetical protein KJ940_10150 [Myxococcota bacterium]|nr:hypothetical protein [Myxococcota bacterium]